MGQIIGQLGYLFNLIFTYPIFNVLMLLYRLFGDFGLSIIVLTLIIRLVLFPLTLKQLKSMKATQALQPQMAEVRKKYKDQRAQAEAMQEERGLAIPHLGDSQLHSGRLQPRLVDCRLQGVGRKDVRFRFQE